MRCGSIIDTATVRRVGASGVKRKEDKKEINNVYPVQRFDYIKLLLPPTSVLP